VLAPTRTGFPSSSGQRVEAGVAVLALTRTGFPSLSGQMGMGRVAELAPTRSGFPSPCSHLYQRAYTPSLHLRCLVQLGPVTKLCDAVLGRVPSAWRAWSSAGPWRTPDPSSGFAERGSAILPAISPATGPLRSQVAAVAALGAGVAAVGNGGRSHVANLALCGPCPVALGLSG
jgi:hypothetical protein